MNLIFLKVLGTVHRTSIITSNVVFVLMNFLLKIYFMFFFVYLGTNDDKEQWRHCVTDTEDALGFATSAILVRETFHQRDKQLVDEFS